MVMDTEVFTGRSDLICSSHSMIQNLIHGQTIYSDDRQDSRKMKNSATTFFFKMWSFLTLISLKCGVLRVVVNASSLEAFKARLNEALSDLVWWVELSDL